MYADTVHEWRRYNITIIYDFNALNVQTTLAVTVMDYNNIYNNVIVLYYINGNGAVVVKPSSTSALGRLINSPSPVGAVSETKFYRSTARRYAVKEID